MIKYIDYSTEDEVSLEVAQKERWRYRLKYDSPEEALRDLISHNKHANIHHTTVGDIKRITKTLIHKGIKLDTYFTWDKHIFIIMLTHVGYVGTMDS